MSVWSGTDEAAVNKVVKETTLEQRRDIAVYFDSFASLNRVDTKANRISYQNQFRLTSYKQGSDTELAPKGSALGRWGGSNGQNYTKEKGQAPIWRPDNNRYDGYTLYEWLDGDYDGADLDKIAKLFGYPGYMDKSNRVYKK